jgi:hypothetical protein
MTDKPENPSDAPTAVFDFHPFANTVFFSFFFHVSAVFIFVTQGS